MPLYFASLVNLLAD